MVLIYLLLPSTLTLFKDLIVFPPLSRHPSAPFVSIAFIMSANSSQLIQQLLETAGSAENLLRLLGELVNSTNRENDTLSNAETVSSDIPGENSESSSTSTMIEVSPLKGVAPVFVPSEEDKKTCSTASKEGLSTYYYALLRVLTVNGLNDLMNHEKFVALCKDLDRDRTVELQKTLRDVNKFVLDTAPAVIIKDASARILLNNNNLPGFLTHLKTKHLTDRDNPESVIGRKLDSLTHSILNKKNKEAALRLKEVIEDVEIFNVNNASIEDRIFEYSVTYLYNTRSHLPEYSVNKLRTRSKSDIRKLMEDDFNLVDLDKYDKYFREEDTTPDSAMYAKNTFSKPKANPECQKCGARVGHKRSCTFYDPKVALASIKRRYEEALKEVAESEKKEPPVKRNVVVKKN